MIVMQYKQNVKTQGHKARVEHTSYFIRIINRLMAFFRFETEQ